MSIRFITAFILVIFAAALQFTLASAGIFVNLILASLITAAFMFGIGELAALILLAVFVLNWQPAPSEEIALLIFIPVIAYAVRRRFPWRAWLGDLLVVGAGIFIFYAALAPGAFVTMPMAFALDLFASVIFSGLVYALFSALS